MANFVKHTACPACGSSDARGMYDDGSEYCYACTARSGPHDQPKRKDLHMEQNDAELQRLITKWQSGTPTALPERGITSTYVKHYGVVVDGDRHYYPYFTEDSPSPVAFKVRTVSTKGFTVVGNVKEAGLFGQQRFGNHNKKRVVVCEGELDALACSQMMDGKVPVVSLKSGASGAGRDFKAAYSFLDGFAEIILCFDADDAGKDGVQKAADVFAGKIRVMNLDARLGKDACDYLKTGRKAEFVQMYWDAPIFTPSGVISKEELWEMLSTAPPEPIGDYPWGPINDLTFGFRPTELITLCAGSGLGKSAVLREIVMHLKNTTKNKIGVLFMEESVTRTAEGFMGIDLGTPVHLPTSTVQRGSDAYRQSFDRVFGDDQLFIMDASFDTGATVDAVVSRVRFMAKALDCKVVVLDHISILVSGGQYGDERKALDAIMTKLRTLTQDTGITLLAVSHLKRPDGKGHEEGAVTSVAQLRGSASIAQLSDFVIGLERNAQADDPIERNTTHLRVLKNRFSGQTGPAGHLLYDTNTGRLTEHEPIQSEEDAL
jgi:twinkle protein